MDQQQFKGNIIMRLLGILLAYSIVPFSIFIILKHPDFFHDEANIIGSLFLFSIPFAFVGFMSNWVIVDRQIFTVKNYIYFWQSKELIIANIKLVESTSIPKLGFGLKITMKNNKSIYYGTNAFFDSDYEGIYNVLKSNGVSLKGFFRHKATLINT